MQAAKGKAGNLFFNKVTILGVGLIGASFALALKKNGLCGGIAGFGRSAENLAEARKRGIIDSFERSAAEACKDADLVVLATPVRTFPDLVRQSSGSFKPGSVVTDTGSVKGDLVYEVEKLMPAGVRYIGSHPIAGGDRSGIDSSRADLFEKSKCIVTPTADSDSSALEMITGLWRSIGADVITMDPARHDRIYASVSHLPHVVAYALVNTAADMDPSCLEFSGRGFRDTTRIACSSPELWRDICLMNRNNLIEMIAVFQKNLDTLSRYLRDSDSASLEREFDRARTLREGIGQN
ncbi:MAG: prephenate dehydrogenase/arogenate dehydrogenase family protein [Candidatus Sulfobium sp.]|jgi:prephenate dehydrogenase